MAFEIVQCDVVFYARIKHTDSEGRNINRVETVAQCETKGDAARALAEYGLTLIDGWLWRGDYCYGQIDRVLVER